MYFIPAPVRLKPVHKVEGMTNGTASGAGQQQQQQQGSGQVDISTQVQQYQQFLGECSEQIPTGMTPMVIILYTYNIIYNIIYS